MNEKLIRKDLRSRFNPAVWSLIVYYVMMSVGAVIVMYAAMAIDLFRIAASGSVDSALDSFGTVDPNVAAWSYVLTVAAGIAVLLLWKKPAYFRNDIFARGRPMRVGTFFEILCIFLGIQLVTLILNQVIETILNMLGLSMMAAMESAGGMQESFAMFLYASILAPITEEILFRGLVQRTLLPYGKKFAIFCSAFLFGIFHGNLAQTPFAFMAGLVLGYVAAEYNIVWAMVLHMVNNLVLSDMLSRLTSFLPEDAANLIVIAVILVLGIIAAVILIVRRKRVAAYLRQERMHKLCLQAFFSHPAVIILFVVTFANGALLILLSSM